MGYSISSPTPALNCHATGANASATAHHVTLVASRYLRCLAFDRGATETNHIACRVHLKLLYCVQVWGALSLTGRVVFHCQIPSSVSGLNRRPVSSLIIQLETRKTARLRVLLLYEAFNGLS
jgi:hypothetical protein